MDRRVVGLATLLAAGAVALGSLAGGLAGKLTPEPKPLKLVSGEVDTGWEAILASLQDPRVREFTSQHPSGECFPQLLNSSELEALKEAYPDVSWPPTVWQVFWDSWSLSELEAHYPSVPAHPYLVAYVSASGEVLLVEEGEG
ncbi:MAG: hypothetical protein DRN96_08255 [Thermoproteota archaeon]|nr:MAG: hypothetical protein DRN96_08255 [Candidatus Korarchaeota archaeon]